MGQLYPGISGLSGLSGLTPIFGPSDGGAPVADFTYWSPDAEPLATSALDDEFDDGALDVKWTEFDPAGDLTVVEQEYGLEMTAIPNTNTGIYQSIPSGDFTIWTKFSMLFWEGAVWTGLTGQLILWEDATNINGDLITFRFLAAQVPKHGLLVSHWTDYTTYSSNLYWIGVSEDWYATTLYLRIRRTGTTYAFDVSSNGLGWERVYSGAISFTPTHFGPGAKFDSTGNSVVVEQFFRYLDSDIGLDVVSGDRINGYRS